MSVLPESILTRFRSVALERLERIEAGWAYRLIQAIKVSRAYRSYARRKYGVDHHG